MINYGHFDLSYVLNLKKKDQLSSFVFYLSGLFIYTSL